MQEDASTESAGDVSVKERGLYLGSVDLGMAQSIRMRNTKTGDVVFALVRRGAILGSLQVYIGRTPLNDRGGMIKTRSRELIFHPR